MPRCYSGLEIFGSAPHFLAANFSTGIGPNANFLLDTADRTWGEVGIGITVGEGPFRFTAGGDMTIGRGTADTQVVRGTMSYRF